MGIKTEIEWTDATWNPVTGCNNRHCKQWGNNCYAEGILNRFGALWGCPAENPFTPTFHENWLGIPGKWKKPKRIFVCSLGDMFCDGAMKLNYSPKSSTDGCIFKVIKIIRENLRHTFIILTKRADNMKKFFDVVLVNNKIPDNLIPGISASTHEELEKRIYDLHSINAACKILSLEPLLGEIRLSDIELQVMLGIDGVIVGGENGTGARPMHPDWVRKIRDDCETLGIPFFFKGWGAYLPFCQDSSVYLQLEPLDASNFYTGHKDDLGVPLVYHLVGKKNSGRLLDGQEHNEMPEVKG